MTLIIPGLDKGPPTHRCRICKRPFFMGEHRAFVRHTQVCAESYMDERRERRESLDNFLKPADPEWAAYVQSGRYRPLTEPKSD